MKKAYFQTNGFKSFLKPVQGLWQMRKTRASNNAIKITFLSWKFDDIAMLWISSICNKRKILYIIIKHHWLVMFYQSLISIILKFLQICFSSYWMQMKYNHNEVMNPRKLPWLIKQIKLIKEVIFTLLWYIIK